MPILWRYLVSYFFKITFFCVAAFIAILLTMRLDEIAHFAAMGAPFSYIFLFTLYQIPYILPIALPLSCLIAALILIQRLSTSHELTALRASGFGLSDILAPILMSAAFLSVGNFWIVSELATQSHLQTNLLKSNLRAVNPLLLLHNKHLMRLKGFYFEALGASKMGEFASDAIVAVPDQHNQRLHLLIAKQLEVSSQHFIGHRTTLITGYTTKGDEDFDHVLVENMEKSVMNINDFSNLLQKKIWTINNDYLQISLLFARIQEQREQLEQLEQLEIQDETKKEIKSVKSQLNRSFSEIMRRLSIAIAVFSFTLMGIACGMTISRKRNYYTLYLAIFLTTCYLVAFFIGKAVDQKLVLASLFYLAPHLLIILVSVIMLQRITRGIE